MRAKEVLLRISHSAWARGCIHRLGLNNFAQRLYALLRGDGKTLRLKVNGVVAVFSAETPVELRCVEGSVLSESELLNAIQETLKPGDVFLDVGSNLGIFTVFGAKAVGPQGAVIACEPGTRTFHRLQKNMELNQLHNVTYLRLALSDTRAVKKLVVDDPDSFGLMAHLSDVGGPSAEDVQTVDYDSLAEDEGLPIPHVVKMDIEGHEYGALKRMKRTLSNPVCTALFCEIRSYALPHGVSLKDVVTLIESFGFECLSMRMRGREHQVTATKHCTRSIIGQTHHANAYVAR
jgi:FkbM family methyltransferase